MIKNFNVLRGITMASALHGDEKKELLNFINQIEKNVTHIEYTHKKITK